MSTSPVRHAAREMRHRLLRNVTLSLLTIALFVSTAAFAVYHDLQSRLTTVSVDDILGADRPSAPEGSDFDGRALNILVMGSDSRSGEVVDDGTEGMRSDTAMIVHLSADRTRMDVVSIPRDTMVEVPACPLPDGSQSDASSYAIFNSAFSTGADGSTDSKDVKYAAGCTIKTVEKLTNVRMDEFMVVDFTGFENMVNSLGGVPMYIDEDVDDDKADLHLTKGCTTLNGGQALGYARARYSLGDGSDVSRIGRQQQLVAAIMRTAQSKNLLTDTNSLYDFANSALSTLTVSSDLGDLSRLGQIAHSAANIGMDNINFVTMPVEQDLYDPNRLAPSDQADDVWNALREDKPIPE
ncbi:MAG: LCP family protein, partial [Actinomyces sp.]